MSAYFVIDLTITDAEKMAEYVRGVEPVVAKHRGRFLVRGGAWDVMEGEWHPDEFVLIKFADRAAIHRFFASEEYQPLKALRRQSARTNIGVIIDGEADGEQS